ncbi:uncharacterized protein LOC143178163 [Calliopsis andreniformis]|uniref:uncharacterized protein LOC143178163 n=1 Tax=Calliopsis andreniformis TaxID=337506 RepID=UPI003FCE9328
MSDTESFKSDADRSTVVSDTTDPIQINSTENIPCTGAENVISTTEVQNTAAQNGKIKVCSTENGNSSPEETKASECVKESVENSASKNLENEPKEQPSNTSEIQQTSIGAGDTCFIGKRDENANVEESNKEIINQTSIIEDKLLVNDDNKASDEDIITISKLKQEVLKTIEDRESYRKKLENTEKKLASLQACYDALLKGEGDEVMLRRMVDQLKGKLIQTSLQLEDRTRTVVNQEKQISALNSQVASLKEVESLTRSLLQIRNMEVKHLQAEVDNMEVRINEERERYNTMINKMDAAVKLNADLKKEYETQLRLFRDLREKYEEKVTLLTEEKRALENNTQAVPE